MPEHIYINNYVNERPKGMAIAILVEEHELEFVTPDGHTVTLHDHWYRYMTLAELVQRPATRALAA